MRVCVRACACACVHVCMCVRVCACMFVHVNVYMYVCDVKWCDATRRNVTPRRQNNMRVPHVVS